MPNKALSLVVLGVGLLLWGIPGIGQVQFNFELGTSSKVTPIDILYNKEFSPIGSLDNINYFTDRQMNLVGTGLNYGLSMYLPELNAKFHYTQTLRYDHVHYLKNISTNSMITEPSVNEFFLEHHFYFRKYLGRRELKPYVEFGLSKLNGGLSYNVRNINNNEMTYYLDFMTVNAGIGIEYKTLSFGLNMLYAGRVSNPFSQRETQAFILPEIKINYIIPIRLGN